MTLKINEANYPQYKKVFEIIWSHESTLYPPAALKNADPVEILNSWEQKSMALARRGLRAGLNDALVSLRELPDGMLREIDLDLKKNNLPSLAILTSIVKKTIRKVLKDKKISKENEYYMVKEFLMSPENELTEDERTLLYQYLEAFELA